MNVIIQNRRGRYVDTIPQKLLPGEVLVVTEGDPDSPSGKSVYVGTKTGEVERLAFDSEVGDYNIQASQAAKAAQQALQNTSEIHSQVQEKYSEIEGLATSANQSATDAANTLARVNTTIESAKTQALQDFNTAANAKQTSVIDAIDSAYEEDKVEFQQTYNDAIDTIERRASEIAGIVVEADKTATRALNITSNFESEMAELGSQVDQYSQITRNIQGDLERSVFGGYVDNGGYLVLTDMNGDQTGDRIGPFAGGGGGGGGGAVTEADMTATNTTGWVSTTISEDANCKVKILWSSIENDIPTGNGTATIRVNNIIKATLEVQQGEITIDVKPYISSGTNKVRINIADVYGQERAIAFNISVVTLRLTSSFTTTEVFSSSIPFPYTPIGEVSKTVYIELDGTVIHTQTTSVSNRQVTYTIPAQSHGAHKLRAYFEATINEQVVRSNELYYEFISIEQLNNTPIIVSPFNKTSVTQYDSVVIPYTVYDPSNAQAHITLSINDTVIDEAGLDVDRSEHSYTFRANEAGTVKFAITCRGITKQFTFTVEELSINVRAETNDLALYLSSQGRSNNEANPETWTYNGITTTFTGFNGRSDRWQKDEDGIDVCRVSENARLTINYKPNAVDFRSSGKTIEFEFATRNILNYDTTVISCMSGGIGFSFTAQKALLKSELAAISTQYKEDEHVRIAFDVQKRTENNNHPLMFVYINGIASGVVPYPDDDDFSQTSPVNITIGSNYCTVDLYCIRIYDSSLTKEQILNNWIADTQIGSELLDRYTRNNIYDGYGNIVISQLPKTLPYMVISCDELPQYKGNKKTCDITFTNPQYPSKSFTSTGVEIDVQGTSSQYYPRKNYKTKHKNGFTSTSGSSETYAMDVNSIPVNVFCFKADVASSEGANNVELVRLYNSICPYKTPAQVANPQVRQGIDGFPMVIFWHDTVTDTTTFLGKYNFNNDKSTEDVFGFASPDESWETLNNTDEHAIYKSADYGPNSGWEVAFEARYPDTKPAYSDTTQLAEFAAWAVSTDREAATGDTIPSVTYDGVTYTEDTADYRLAKFKAEASRYMELDSAIFYYLFTELFLMVDSRAKNAFPSFIGSNFS